MELKRVAAEMSFAAFTLFCRARVSRSPRARHILGLNLIVNREASP